MIRVHKAKVKGERVVWRTLDGVVIWCSNWLLLWNLNAREWNK